MPYRVKEEFDYIPHLSTQINNVSIALNQAFEHTVPAHAGRPARKATVRLATQDDLKKLYDAGNPVIEEYENAKAEKAAAATQ